MTCGDTSVGATTVHQAIGDDNDIGFATSVRGLIHLYLYLD